jgi:tetratricopeptide (TPR) repeat protein
LKKTLDPAVDIVTMKYLTHFDENGVPILFSTRERLMRREKNYTWIDPVHECIPLIGNVFSTDIEVHHKKPKENGNSKRNLNIYANLEKSGKPLTPRQQYYYARELKDHGELIKSVYWFEKFLDSKKGWHEDNIAACFSLSLCCNVLGDRQKSLAFLLKSFEYAPPRAEICCEIGYWYKSAKQFDTALKWFEIAANLGTPDNLGFILWDYWGYIPNIECCVCCWHLGKNRQAAEFNERAAVFKPNSPTVENNRAFLKNS